MMTVIVGLDIGTTKIACFVGTKNEHGKIEILSMGKSESLGVTRGMVSNINNTVESIKNAVEEAKSRLSGELIIRNVIVGIAGQHIKSLQHRGIYTRYQTENEISQKDIDALIEDMYRLVMQPGEAIIHVLPQEYIVDNEQGLIAERTIALRPYPALKLFRDAMYEALQDKLPPDVWDYPTP